MNEPWVNSLGGTRGAGGFLDPTFPGGECGQQHARRGDRGIRPGLPPDLLAFDQGCQQGDQRRGEQRNTEPVRPDVTALFAGCGQHPHGGDRSGHPDGDVQPEDKPPPQIGARRGDHHPPTKGAAAVDNPMVAPVIASARTR